MVFLNTSPPKTTMVLFTQLISVSFGCQNLLAVFRTNFCCKMSHWSTRMQWIEGDLLKYIKGNTSILTGRPLSWLSKFWEPMHLPPVRSNESWRDISARRPWSGNTSSTRMSWPSMVLTWLPSQEDKSWHPNGWETVVFWTTWLNIHHSRSML